MRYWAAAPGVVGSTVADVPATLALTRETANAPNASTTASARAKGEYEVNLFMYAFLLRITVRVGEPVRGFLFSLGKPLGIAAL
jgi:hypothetical protein